jgi:hypothetical protein
MSSRHDMVRRTSDAGQVTPVTVTQLFLRDHREASDLRHILGGFGESRRKRSAAADHDATRLLPPAVARSV